MTTLTISEIKTRAVLAPLARPITTAFSAIEKAPLLLFDVETKEGIVGRSYLFCYTPLTLRPLTELVANIRESQVGQPLAPLERYADLAQTFRLLGRQGLVAMAIAGLDMAYWDAFGQAHGRSVAEMLGASNRAVPCYDSHGVFDASRDVAALEKSMADGFGAVKFKIGVSDLQTDVDTLLAIREIIGPDRRLMVDYNQSLFAPEAIRRIRRFDALGLDLDWVEEPVSAEDFAGHQTVRANVATPIQTGENWWLPEDAARAIDAGISDHVMLDAMKIGGVTGWMRAAAMAEAKSLPVSSHLFNEVSAHLLAATPNAHLLEFMDVAAAILVDPYVIDQGTLMPRGPGLDLNWDLGAVASYAA